MFKDNLSGKGVSQHPRGAYAPICTSHVPAGIDTHRHHLVATAAAPRKDVIRLMTQRTTPDTTVVEKTLDHRSIMFVFVGLMLAMFASSLDQTIVSTALPTIVGELDGVNHMLWITTAYSLAATVMMPIYGKLGDLIGRKSLFIGALVIFIGGSVVCALGQSMTALIVGRAIQGLGGGGLMILSQAIIADIIPSRDRGRYMGVIGAVFGVSAVVGPLLGGFFTDGIGWRYAFWMNIPLAAIAIIAAVFFLPKPHRTVEHPRFDFAGTALLAIAASSLILLTSWGGTQYDWNSPVIIGMGVTCVVAAIAFVLVERRVVEPLIPLSLFKNRNFNLVTVAGLIIMVGMMGCISYMPTYMQIIKDLGATASGYAMIPMMVGVLGTSISSGVLASKTGRYKWMPIASCLVIALSLILMSTLTVGTSFVVLEVFIFVLGFGIGLGQQILVLIVQNEFPSSIVGTATAANNFFRQLGGTLGMSLVGALFTSRLTDQLATQFSSLGGVDSLGVAANAITPALVRTLPDQISNAIAVAYNAALTPVFSYIAPLKLVGAVLLLFVRETPLATTVAGSGHQADAPVESGGPAFVAPVADVATASPHAVRTDAVMPMTVKAEGKTLL